jgi:hypothetical protein
MHWTVGEMLGYKMGMSLNKAYPLSGAYREQWHYTLDSAVGPAITLIQTICFFLLIRKYHNRLLFPFLFGSFYLELLSGIMNYRHANDLGRISQTFHLGLFTIPVIVVAMHSFFLYRTICSERYSFRFVVWTFFLVLVFSSIWVLLNNKFHIAIL